MAIGFKRMRTSVLRSNEYRVYKMDISSRNWLATSNQPVFNADFDRLKCIKRAYSNDISSWCGTAVMTFLHK